ncbi:CoA-transferase [Syntrophomonas palmitatica]|uniref:CoA-transferase n=1 Tax=Syntrophomonas palmitatica TaxID=402877 RepID=UPI0006D0D0C6|nr:CoA-transferase [Syntrophomonas palmitatica]
MSSVAPANPLEMLAYNISLLINNDQIVYVGTGLPMVGALLAKKTHAPDITMVYESGGQDPLEGDMPWSVGCPFTFRKSPMSMEMAVSFGQCALGYVDIAFQGGAQIDMYGNVNTSVIGAYGEA